LFRSRIADFESYVEECGLCGTSVRPRDTFWAGGPVGACAWYWIAHHAGKRFERVCEDCRRTILDVKITPPKGFLRVVYVSGRQSEPDRSRYALSTDTLTPYRLLVSPQHLWIPGSFRKLVNACPRVDKQTLSYQTLASSSHADFDISVADYMTNDDPTTEKWYEEMAGVRKIRLRLATSPAEAAAIIRGRWRSFGRVVRQPIPRGNLPRKRGMAFRGGGVLDAWVEHTDLDIRCARVSQQAWLFWGTGS
jgi:hypothetical protein